MLAAGARIFFDSGLRPQRAAFEDHPKFRPIILPERVKADAAYVLLM
jgi:hypothetical protein